MFVFGMTGACLVQQGFGHGHSARDSASGLPAIRSRRRPYAAAGRGAAATAASAAGCGI